MRDRELGQKPGLEFDATEINIITHKTFLLFWMNEANHLTSAITIRNMRSLYVDVRNQQLMHEIL